MSVMSVYPRFVLLSREAGPRQYVTTTDNLWKLVHQRSYLDLRLTDRLKLGSWTEKIGIAARRSDTVWEQGRRVTTTVMNKFRSSICWRSR